MLSATALQSLSSYLKRSSHLPPVSREFHSLNPSALVFFCWQCVFPHPWLCYGAWKEWGSLGLKAFLLLLRDLWAPAPLLPKGLRSRRWERNVVDNHQSQNPRISILSAKQLEVFEVLFGAYSSEPLCQGGIFIIKKNKLAVVHLAELNSKVIRVVYAFLIKSSFETNVRIKWYYTINIQGR